MTLQWPDLKRMGTKADEVNVYTIDIHKSMETATGTTEGVTTSTKEESELERRAIKFILDNKTIFEELAKL